MGMSFWVLWGPSPEISEDLSPPVLWTRVIRCPVGHDNSLPVPGFWRFIFTDRGILFWGIKGKEAQGLVSQVRPECLPLHPLSGLATSHLQSRSHLLQPVRRSVPPTFSGRCQTWIPWPVPKCIYSKPLSLNWG